jgi:hypothetical protein
LSFIESPGEVSIPCGRNAVKSEKAGVSMAGSRTQKRDAGGGQKRVEEGLPSYRISAIIEI